MEYGTKGVFKSNVVFKSAYVAGIELIESRIVRPEFDGLKRLPFKTSSNFYFNKINEFYPYIKVFINIYRSIYFDSF